MKKLAILFLCIWSINGNSAELKGFSDPNSGIKAFFEPLKLGPDHINEATGQLPFTGDRTRKYIEKEMNTGSSGIGGQLQSIMVNQKQGKVVKFTESDSIERLNGNFIIKTYEIKFQGGQTKQIQFKFIRPMANGNYQFADAVFLD